MNNCNQHITLRLLQITLLLAALLTSPIGVKAQTSIEQAEITRALDESSGIKGILNRVGLKNAEVTETEAFFDFNKQSGEKGQFSSDGPTVTLQAEISKDLIPIALSQLGTVTASTTLMTNELAMLDQCEVRIPIAHDEVD